MTIDTLFEQEFTKLLDALLRTKLAGLAHAQAVTNYAEFTFRVGVITALRDMVPDLIAETNTKINER